MDFFNLPTINETVKEKNNIFLGEEELKKHIDFVKKKKKYNNDNNNNNNNNKIYYIVRGRRRTFFR